MAGNFKLSQIYITNPVTTIGATDLFYIDQGGNTDGAMIGSVLLGLISPLTTKGDLYTYSTANARLAIGGTDGMLLNVHAAASTGMQWSTLTSLIDSLIGNTQGDILYRSATAWTVLAPGTSGYFLQTQGAAANPIWATAGGGNAAGSTNDIQFNTSGSFAADTGNFGWISATHSLYAGSSAEVSAGVQCGFAFGLSATVLANHGIALGYGSTVESPWGFASGYNAQSNHQGSYVFADSTNSGKSDTANNQWVTCFTGGYYNWVGATLATKIDTNSNFINNKGTADQSKSVQTPSTGFSITIGAGIKTLMLTPSGTLTTGTITMPASPIDGQEIRVCSTQIVTSLTVSANAGQSITGAPTTITATGGFMYLYNLASTTWVRLY